MRVQQWSSKLETLLHRRAMSSKNKNNNNNNRKKYLRHHQPDWLVENLTTVTAAEVCA